MSETSDLGLRAVQILISIPVLVAFIVGGLPVLLPLLFCRFVAPQGRAAT